MNTVQEAGNPPFDNLRGQEQREVNGFEDLNQTERLLILQRALRTLIAIRQRYEVGCCAHPDSRFYGVQVAVDGGDVAWITATIEALEKALPAGTAQTAAGSGS